MNVKMALCTERFNNSVIISKNVKNYKKLYVTGRKLVRPKKSNI